MRTTGAEPFFEALTLQERHPDSSVRSLRPRFGNKFAPLEDYTLADERFVISHPPQSHADPEQPVGVLIWVDSGPNGECGQPYAQMARQRNLIVIAAHNAGNERPAMHRIGLALDALHYCQTQFTIDESRIYVSGFSGGARMASMLAQTFPDMFQGCLSLCGFNYHRALKTMPSIFGQLSAAQRQRILKDLRWVLLTGSEDFNLDQMRDAYHNGFLQDGAAHAWLCVVPDMAHEYPDPELFGRCLDYLDDPTTPTVHAPDSEGSTSGETDPAEDPQALAEQDTLLQTIREAALLGDREAAEQAATTLRERYPESDATAEAEELLELLP